MHERELDPPLTYWSDQALRQPVLGLGAPLGDTAFHGLYAHVGRLEGRLPCNAWDGCNLWDGCNSWGGCNSWDGWRIVWSI